MPFVSFGAYGITEVERCLYLRHNRSREMFVFMFFQCYYHIYYIIVSYLCHKYHCLIEFSVDRNGFNGPNSSALWGVSDL